MNIVRKDFTTVAKAEINSNPIAAPITTMGGKLLDIAWVPRDDQKAAVTALQPIEELARKGLSVLIAPEGTAPRATASARSRRAPSASPWRSDFRSSRS